MLNWVNNLKMRSKFLLINGLAIFLIIILITTIYISINSLLDSARWVQHTEKVIAHGHELTEELINMETGMRGFLITGNPEFLEPFDKGLSKFSSKIEDTRILVSDNPKQVANLDEINAIAMRWINDVVKVEIRERRKLKEGTKDFEYLQHLLGKGEGKRILDENREVLNNLESLFRESNNHNAVYMISSIGKSLIDQETGQRGFLITGKDEFLEPYYEGIKNFNLHIKKLYLFIGKAYDRDKMMARIDNLKQLTDSWREKLAMPEIILRKEVKDGKRDFAEIQDVLSKDKGKTAFDQIRNILESMKHEFDVSENERGKLVIYKLAKYLVDQETGKRGFLLTGKDKYLEPYRNGQVLGDKTIDELRALVENDYNINVAKEMIDKLSDLSRLWLARAAQPEIALRNEINQNTLTMKNIIDVINSKAGKTLMDNMRFKLDEFIGEEERLIALRQVKKQHTSNRTLFIVYVGSGLSIIFIVITGLVVSNTVARQFSKFNESANSISEGDYSRVISITSRDELGMLAGSFNKMIDSLIESNAKEEKAMEERELTIRSLKNLMEFSSILREEIQEAELIKHMAHILKEDFNLDVIAVLMLNREKDILDVALIEPQMPEEELIKPETFLNPSICRVLRTGNKLIVRDVNKDIPCECLSLKIKEGGYACYPLITGGITTGVILMIKKERDFWDVEEMQSLFSTYVGLVASALHRVRLMDMSRHAAITDELTGVYNRRFFDETLEKQILLEKRRKEPLSLLIMDIDHFKNFNDSYGHIAGDRVLKQLTMNVRDSIRGSDILARYGGEEFVVIMPDTGLSNARKKADKIRRNVESMNLDNIVSGQSLKMTISIGVSSFPEHGTEFNTLVASADGALYKAKESGRNRVEVP